MDEPTEADPEPVQKPLIKRRWAIVTRAGGGAALLAIAGTLALSDPSDGTDPGQDSAGGDVQISAES
jgi:hypothetical protein